ncbi:MAG TPA: hypothetical protein VFT48_09665 [Pyrinomonadaceae bacterium]|nr:hypothetical protein [Pyrinomonadaceae bacterium]
MKFLLAILVASLVLVQAPAAKLNGRWKVKFKMSGLEKNVIFEAKENGAGSFKLLDTGVDDKPVAEPVPGVWSQLTNDRVSFSGETELPLGTCCREIGTMMFKGRFTSANAISGTVIFVTSVDQEESAFKFRSEVGTFEATKL